LLLRMYMRLSNVRPGLAQAGIAELQNEPGGYGFIGTGGTAQIKYFSSAGNTNPLYSEMANLNFTQNLIASATAFDTMANRGDARIEVLYEAVGPALPQGAYNTS